MNIRVRLLTRTLKIDGGGMTEAAIKIGKIFGGDRVLISTYFNFMKLQKLDKRLKILHNCIGLISCKNLLA